MSLTRSSALIYSSDLFTNRETEIAFVEKIAGRIGAGTGSRRRTIVFHGERGSGKTWLGLHLKQTVLPTTGEVTPLFISLAAAPPGYAPAKGANEWWIEQSLSENPDFEVITRRIVRWVAGKVGASVAPKASLRELAGWLARDVKQTYEKRILTLILDSVFEADWGLLKMLEQHLLAPLITLPKVLIILAGRGRHYPWKSPYLRVEIEDMHLEHFDLETTENQLKLQKPDAEQHAAKIMRLGGGHPLSNVLLAEKPDPSESLDRIANELLDILPEEYEIPVREYFEALCLLDGFRENEIPHMLAARFDDQTYLDWPGSQIRSEVRDELKKTGLMRWDDGRFTIDESIRRILESYLEEQQPVIWQRLQCAAYRLYKQWATDFEKFKDYYDQRAAKHAKALEHKNFSVTDCVNGTVLVGELSGS